MHRAGERCFELLALIRSPQLLSQSYSPGVVFFFITKLRETNRTQHVTIVFNVNQFLSFYSLIEGIPQLDKTLGRTGQTRLLAELDKPWGLAQRQRLCKE